MKNNNKGLSLVELVIVISIMSVMAALMSLGLSTVVSKPADECGQKIASALKLSRVNAMGKRSSVIELSQADNGAAIWMVQKVTNADGYTSNTGSEVGAKGIVFMYHIKGTGDSEYVTLSSVTKIVLSFDRSTGGFNPVVVEGAGAYAVEESEKKYIDHIMISKGSKTVFLDLAYLTGKVTIK